MKIIKDYERIKYLVDQIKVEKVYPLSITEGIQKGEVFVDHIEAPTVALFWHYCGFANISGKYDEKFVEETMNMMQNPQDGHSGRMALQIDYDNRLQGMIRNYPYASMHERYVFRFAGEKYCIPKDMELRLEDVSSLNYGLMKGRIIPTFSWPDKEAFLKNGFGYCLMKDGQMLACSFSSGVSKDYVDIGVETAEECRGQGYGRIVAAAMLRETLRRGKLPVWGCDTRNEASMKLACSVGFEIVGTHPWYKCER